MTRTVAVRPRLLSLLWLLVASCGSTAPAAPGDLRILFVGNSLTYVNDMPALVERLGRGDGSRRVSVATVAYADYSLEDHWARGDAVRAIREARWDFVVLQQGPSAQPESRRLLADFAGRFAAEIRRAGARPALYMVWPPLAREYEWSEVSASYAAAAEVAGARLLPAGEALRAARNADGSITLLQADGFHPSPAGSYLAALVVYAAAAGTPPAGLTDRAGGIDLPPGQVAVLEAAAATALEEWSGD